MSKDRVCHILNQHLDMRKLSARWLPRLLTLDQIKISNALLAQFGRNKFDFWRRLITLDIPLYARNKNTIQTVDCRGAPKKQKLFFRLGK